MRYVIILSHNYRYTSLITKLNITLSARNMFSMTENNKYMYVWSVIVFTMRMKRFHMSFYLPRSASVGSLCVMLSSDFNLLSSATAFSKRFLISCID